jgi:hypothetical protein
MADNYDTDIMSRTVSQIAQNDFERAHRKAFMQALLSSLRREPNWLISFEEVKSQLPFRGQHYRGVQQVPVKDIIGSVDRYRDFNRAFLPTQTFTRPRWESVDRAALTDVSLPPVQLYKVDDVYFVKDGNHRVSVAREKGIEYIDADVIEMDTPVSLATLHDARDLIRLGEYARFLDQTKLDKLRPGMCIEFSTLGRYDVLIDHISAHRWYMGIDQDHPISWEEAVLDWYDNVYMPLDRVIRESNILRNFPGRTVGDLYLWIMDHRWYLRENTGQEVGLETAALSYDAKYATWTRRVLRSLRRFNEAAARPFVVTGRMIRRALSASDENVPEAAVLDQESLARSEGI